MKLKRDALEKWNGKKSSDDCTEAVAAEAVAELKVEKEQLEAKGKLLYWLLREKGPR